MFAVIFSPKTKSDWENKNKQPERDLPYFTRVLHERYNNLSRSSKKLFSFFLHFFFFSSNKCSFRWQAREFQGQFVLGYKVLEHKVSVDGD